MQNCKCKIQNHRHKFIALSLCILHFALCILLTSCGYNELPEETQNLYLVTEDKEQAVYTLTEGKTKLALNEGLNYYLFVPEASGTYEFAITKGEATVGYYGASTYVMSENIAEDKTETGFTLSISEQMLGNDMVLGITASKGGEAVIKITRTGEAQKTVEDIPVTEYQNTHAPHDHTVPDGVLLYDFRIDSGEEYNLVLGDDGFYHLDSKDGALVYAVLGKKPRISGIFDSFEQMKNYRGITCTFTDEDGNITERVDYTAAMTAYVNAMDDRKGVYPLTEDLKHMIQRIGENWGWYDENSPGYLFTDDEGNKLENLSPDLWMFCLQYEATEETQN